MANHILFNRTNDFVEMILHHSVTVYLLVGSYMFNGWECGAIISCLHDASDITQHLTKMWTSTTCDTMTKISAAACMSCWAYLRCFMLPFCIYHCWTQGLLNNLFESEGITMPVFCYLLSLLAMLHYYWLFLMGSMVFRSARGGKVEDT